MASTAQTKKTAGKKSTGTNARSTTTKKSAPQRSASRTIVVSRGPRPGAWAAVCNFLGVFCFIGYFSVDALLINPVCGFFKGLIGYGYYVLPVALLGCGALLLVVRDGSASRRAACLLAIPAVLGALIHVIAAPELYAASDRFSDLVKALYDSGKAMHSGGVVSGLIGWGGKRLLSVFLALPVLLVVLAALAMSVFRVTPKMLSDRFRERQYRSYEPEGLDEEACEYEEERPVLRRQDPRAEAAASARIQQQSSRRYRHAIDVPMDGEERPAEEYVEKKAGFFNATPRVKTPAQFFEQQETAQLEPQQQ